MKDSSQYLQLRPYSTVPRAQIVPELSRWQRFWKWMRGGR